MRALSDARISFRSQAGVLLAHVTLMPVKDAANALLAPLIETWQEDAHEHGETVIQLRESERYEYEVTAIHGDDLRLRCSLSSRRRSLGIDVMPYAGQIETRSFCGTILLELVEGVVDNTKSAVASAMLDVRSLKLDYRTEYRGMLRRLAEEMMGLVADARSSAKTGFRSTFEQRTDAGWLQIQLELLRETLDSTDFSAAMRRILSFPHQRLLAVSESISTNRPIRWTPAVVQQLLKKHPRSLVPASHALQRQAGLQSVSKQVLVPRKSQHLDIPENRFVKFALIEFRAFLTHASCVFEACQGWGASGDLSRRLVGKVEDWLGHSLFGEVGEMRFAPLGSPVLQRKAGYREMLRWWLRFHSAAELSWEGGEDLFRAGKRDVASLYEYWLFFELLGWFFKKCGGGKRPEVEDLVEGFEDGSPNLRLRKGSSLGPFYGTFSGQSRQLKARFDYNRRFDASTERHACGSWTRRLHPDYTLTFWPESFNEEEAARLELLVHVHFDAKYRVEDLESLFGQTGANDADEESEEGNYKRQDLLKMHAYLDAIKRSQGAYVLYPGRHVMAEKFKGFFHEILPGLGAFGVAPDENGAAQGLQPLEDFLDQVLAHLGDRTTAQERVSYHVAESYRAPEGPCPTGNLVVAERDEMSDTSRALPPAEHHVVVAWYDSPEQLAWTLRKGIANVRLGDRPGSWLIPPEMASTRHVLLRTHGGKVADGIFRLITPGYRVFSAKDLKDAGYPGRASGEIYAVFQVEPDSAYAGRKWDEDEVTRQILAFESLRSYRQVKNMVRCSADPRVLSLRELLRAMR